MPKYCDIKELPEGMFPITFNIIDQYQQKNPLLAANLTCAHYKKCSFRGVQNYIHHKKIE